MLKREIQHKLKSLELQIQQLFPLLLQAEYIESMYLVDGQPGWKKGYTRTMFENEF